MYKATSLGCIKRLTDSATIPLDEGNTDYQEYLKWIEAGNTPEPADVPDPKIAIAAEIDRLERESLLNRGTREMQLFQMEERAQQVSTVSGVPVDTILNANIYYRKLKALDTLITGLRNHL